MLKYISLVWFINNVKTFPFTPLQDNGLEEPLFFVGANRKEVEGALKVLAGYRKDIERREQELRSKLAKIKNDIEIAFNPFKKQKYKLLSILIHDGWAGILKEDIY